MIRRSANTALRTQDADDPSTCGRATHARTSALVTLDCATPPHSGSTWVWNGSCGGAPASTGAGPPPTGATARSTPDEVVARVPAMCGGCGESLGAGAAPVMGWCPARVRPAPLRWQITEHQAQRRGCAWGRSPSRRSATGDLAGLPRAPGARADGLPGGLAAPAVDRWAQLFADCLGGAVWPPAASPRSSRRPPRSWRRSATRSAPRSAAAAVGLLETGAGCPGACTGCTPPPLPSCS
jgi:hypothetical protein